MTTLILGLLLFLGVHTVSIIAPDGRDAMLARWGEAKWKGAYSLISALGLVLIVVGYGLARQNPTVIFTPPTGMRHMALLLLVPVFPLLLASYLPGRIKTATRHPMLLATKLWALSHVLANGNLADVLLFGGFLIWAIAARVSIKRRPRSSNPASLPAKSYNDLIVIVAGLLLYAWFVVQGHAWLIGVSPLPGR